MDKVLVMVKLTYFIVFLGLVSTALAEPIRTPHIEVELVSENSLVIPGQELAVGIRFKPDPGWHIYWKNPGDSGAQPKFDWLLDGERITPTLQWPTPKRLPYGPLMNFGYDSETLLITTILAPQEYGLDGVYLLEVEGEWLVCQEECIPGFGTLKTKIYIGTDSVLDARWKSIFEKTRPNIPSPVVTVETELIQEPEYFSLRIFPPPAKPWPKEGLKLEFFPNIAGVIENAASQELNLTDSDARLRLKRDLNATSDISDLSGVLSANADWPGIKRSAIEISVKLAVEADLPAQVAYKSASSKFPVLSLAVAVGLAFLGGIILNLMPCVLPILALKVVGLMEKRNVSAREAWIQSSLYALGILVSFWALFGLLYILRSTGTKLGWGFQLQSPEFVAGMAMFLFLMGLNLLGVFELGGVLQRIAGRLGIGKANEAAFLHGMLAVLLATPCTAPFMGTALAYALGASVFNGLAVFSALGFGLALPYLLIGFSPGLRKLLPKPGAWMEKLKEFLAFPLFATVVWLGWILVQQAGELGLILLSVGLWLIGLAAWILGRFGSSASRGVRRSAKVIICLLIGAGVFLCTQMQVVSGRLMNAGGDYTDSYGQVWQNFSDAALESGLSSGRPVFIDFTAAWCITCQVNKRLVFGSDLARAELAKHNVLLLRADWTNRDEAIAKKLQSYGREGVPLNILYRTRQDFVILPTVLTADTVLGELGK